MVYWKIMNQTIEQTTFTDRKNEFNEKWFWAETAYQPI